MLCKDNRKEKNVYFYVFIWRNFVDVVADKGSVGGRMSWGQISEVFFRSCNFGI